MRIAFYAPMKPPTSPVPSGDREMARRLMEALAAAGHAVEVAAILRSRDGDGDPVRQQRLKALGTRLAARIVRRYAARRPEQRPRAWLTYHLYHKAPDWIGPAVCDALDIPYIVAEASYAPKQAGGRWALGHEAAAAAIRRADAVIGLNSHDAACVAPLLRSPDRLHALRPFADVASFATGAAREDHRARLARDHDLAPGTPLLLAVAMMRRGDKLDSYRCLGRALALLADRPWQLLVVGDGAARREVEAALAPLGGGRVRFAGARPSDAMPGYYGAADMLVWPACREAYGVVLLEAAAAGLPVIAGDSGGVSDIVRDGETGMLTPEGDIEAFAAAVSALLRAPGRRARLGANAAAMAARDHSIAAASRRLDSIIATVCAEPVA